MDRNCSSPSVFASDFGSDIRTAADALDRLAFELDDSLLDPGTDDRARVIALRDWAFTSVNKLRRLIVE